MKWFWARLIWAWRNIPRTPKKGGGASVWLYLFWQERLTSSGQILVVVTLLLTFLSALPFLQPLRGFALFLWVSHFVAWLRSSRKPKLNLEWDMAKMVIAGEPFFISYHIHNRGKKPIHRISVQWTWEETWIVESGENPEVFSLNPGERKTVHLSVKATGRGLCKLRGPVVFVLEPMGWWRARVHQKKSWELGVFQYEWNMPTKQNHIQQGRQWGEPEWLGTMRLFRKGDTLRNISQRAWARSGKPLVKEMGFSGEGVSLFVDYGCRSFFDRMAIDSLCAQAVLFAQTLEKSGLLDRIWFYGEYLEKQVGLPLSAILQQKLSLLPRPQWWSWPKPILHLVPQTEKGIYLAIERATIVSRETNNA